MAMVSVRSLVRIALFLPLTLLAAAGPAGAAGDGPAPTGPGRSPDLRALFARLAPGQTEAEVAALVGRARLGEGPDPVATWLRWGPVPGGGVAVVRAVFRDGRLARAVYEAFGDTYRRRVTGERPEVEVSRAELVRLLRRGGAAGECRDALEAFHRLVLGLQDRLDPAEQQDWVRALELRRSADAELQGAAR
jgi:hypothetical protein